MQSNTDRQDLSQRTNSIIFLLDTLGKCIRSQRRYSIFFKNSSGYLTEMVMVEDELDNRAAEIALRSSFLKIDKDVRVQGSARFALLILISSE
jgi:hypothetical protein